MTAAHLEEQHCTRTGANARRALVLVVGLHIIVGALSASVAQQQGAATTPKFSWVNPGCEGTTFPESVLEVLAVDEPVEATFPPGLRHATFESPSMKRTVGYCIYLPPGYDDPANKERRYPVVYHLHGGRPGNESRSATLSDPVDEAIRAGQAAPAIYVFPNGGHVSHYDSKQHASMGESVFLRELIPHIEASYRTLPGPGGRALQGFSQGGRGTARILFRHPELFCSAAPGGAGYATEKQISEAGGIEDTPTARNNYGAPLEVGAGNNTYDLAREAVARGAALPPILIWVGTRGFNYDNNLAYMRFLEELEVPFDRLVVPNAGHHPGVIYQTHALDLMTFHERACGWESGPFADSP